MGALPVVVEDAQDLGRAAVRAERVRSHRGELGGLPGPDQDGPLTQQQHLVLLSGHYEGIDQRIRDTVIDQEISIGDYVLTNGTLAAAVVIDALARFIPGVLGEEKSLTHESFTSKLLDFPQYTRPAEFRGMSVPEVLLSGNHAEIEKWRAARQLEKTRQVRPDLLK